MLKPHITASVLEELVGFSHYPKGHYLVIIHCKAALPCTFLFLSVMKFANTLVLQTQSFCSSQQDKNCEQNRSGGKKLTIFGAPWRLCAPDTGLKI